MSDLMPTNIEAEEAILGGILIDPEAISRISEILRPEFFAITAHQVIYRSALGLFLQGQPTDLMTVTTWLTDRNQLEQVGGLTKLAQLVDRTVSAVNIDQYAALVEDKYQRRRLIEAGNNIVQLGYETAAPLETVLDRAEQEVFSITQDRPQQDLVSIGETLNQTFQDLENRNEGLTLPGIPCGFYDLDAMTGGFQRSDLIIVAGRPAMGKCSTDESVILQSDGSLVTIKEIYHKRQAELLTLGKDLQFHLTKPSAFIDDGIKPVFRITTRLGRFIETTITHPFLTIKGWRQLGEIQVGDKIAVPRKMDVFGKETIRDCEVKLLAYLIGDGCLTQSAPHFTNGNTAILQDFAEAATNFGGLTLRFNDKGRRAPEYRVIGDRKSYRDSIKNFGYNLQIILLKRDFDPKKLALELEVPPRLVRSWMEGIAFPNQKLFSGICRVLRVEPEHIADEGMDVINTSHKNPLTHWLEKLGLMGKNAHQKTVPDIVFRLRRSQVALFLNRLFSTDGWATLLTSGQSQLGYCSVSEGLARHVQHLLLRFGIIAALKKRLVKYKNTRNPAWFIDITDAKSINIFISEIGIFGKEAALFKVKEALKNKEYHSNRDLIPVEAWEYLELAKGNESWACLAKRAGIKGYSNIHVGKRALSRERFLVLATALDNLSLKQLANSEVYWDEIVSIEPMGNKQVYDLTIPETHNFVANDICVHNTAFCTNIAHHIAAGQQKLPVAVFSLEMSKEQLVQRILSSEAKIESNRLRSGRISQNEWEPISTAIGNLSELPLFIDDTPNITVMEIRSKVRRLQAEQGGSLGLILLDYLQLMEGSSDNRVQELSRITRSLKGLAREINVPIIALSQLSRSVEARTNKRPMMSDLRECVTGDTPVLLADGRRVPIRDLVGQEPMVLAMNHLEKIAVAKSDKVWRVGVKPVFVLKLASGRTLKATAQHRIYTEQGWQELKSIQVGSRVAIARFIPEPQKPINWKEHEISLLAHLMGDGSYLIGSAGCKVADAGRLKMKIAGINANPNRDTWPKEVFQTIRERMRECNVTTRQMSKLRETAYGGSSHFSFAPSRETVLDYGKLLDSDALVKKASSDLFWDEVINISAAGEEEVFDLTVPGVESWLADGIVSHNSGSIEQDADLVIMLYRDEYYNPDSPDRGIAEVIITKHRNGPTGIIKLLFDAQYTSFRNLASPKRS
ncbi:MULTISPECIES: replicative DNA helicase [unclassified Microcoleus]|uniref:replicative DNA helicase n=1 Tax=unclassified Microcoleus TaxID=2642155 RepID=UPI002FD13C3A